MTYAVSIIGTPVFRVIMGERGRGVVLTRKGFVVCDPAALETGCPAPEDGDATERCALKRGHAHIRVSDFRPKLISSPHFGLYPVSGWLVILPFHDLPVESRHLLRKNLPPDLRIPLVSVKPLREFPRLYNADLRRRLRLEDALADAGLPSPLTLRPSGLHSVPLRIHHKTLLRSVPLPKGEKLRAIVENWSGGDEAVNFSKKDSLLTGEGHVFSLGA